MRYFGAVVLLSIGTIGCGGSSRPVEAVSGVVTLDGTPLAGADVKLMATGGTGYAKTGTDGKYQLVRGVPAGKYKVVVSKFEGGPKPENLVKKKGEEQLDQGQLEAIAMAEQNDPSKRASTPISIGKEIIPPDFSSPDSTKLELDVPKGGIKDANFDLTSK